MSDLSDDETEDNSVPDMNFFSATDSELREWHRRKCEEGDGWSHGFRVEHDDDGQITEVEGGMRRDRQFRDLGRRIPKLFDLESWRKVGEAMGRSPALRSVNFMSCGLTAEKIGALFGGEEWNRGHPTTLEYLDLGGNDIGAPGVAALLPMLKARAELKYLILSSSSLGDDGANLLSEALEHVRIEGLHLPRNNIGDDGISGVLSAANSIHLVHLSLTGNNIGRQGYDSICRYLRSAGLNLKDLLLDCENVENATRVTSSISEAGDSKLETFALWDERTGYIENETWMVQQLIYLVCGNMRISEPMRDKSSFESICKSQHCLRSLGVGRTIKMMKMHSMLKEALHINARAKHGLSATKRTRCKLRSFYFTAAYFDVQPFAELDVNLMPFALELVTRTEICVGREEELPGSGSYYTVRSDDLDAVYRIVRNCHIPGLYSFPPPETEMEELKAQNAALKAEVSALKQKVEQLTAENGQSGGFNSAKKRKEAT